MKKINFVIHPGYGKAGTTFLQEKIFCNLGFVSLGKPHDNKNKSLIKLISLQYKIFQPKYLFNKNINFNFSNSVKNYVNILRDIIEDTNNTNFIISDETIFDRNNYFGYLNLYLLKEIIDLLSDYYYINIKFILTIRSQHEYLISSYAYDYHRKKFF